MSERIIQEADLSGITNELAAIHGNLDVLDSNIHILHNNIGYVNDEVAKLAQQFQDFVVKDIMGKRLLQAETKLVKIRQELEKKYGHYDIVRRTTTGILQADDLGIVKKNTITNATEELMISTPNYWLAPCLVALAAWINDQPELAEKALKEAIKRNDEKTSLFFALVCRRAERKIACLKWTQRYLSNQDEESLDRKTVIVLDAYASGLLGADTEGVIYRQMDEWLTHLSDKPGFIEQQTQQWSEAIQLKRKKIDASSYTYLKKYSPTWPVLEDILEGANLHGEIFNYFTNIFNQEPSSETIKAQLDEILTSLVTDFDDEELPLRKEEKFEQFIVDFKGDEQRATQNMQIEETAFSTHKDFTQLLTDAAMKPESSHSSVSTQKFAVALSRDWISNAYNDLIAQNRMKIPNEIQLKVGNFIDQTTDGQNENELISKFNAMIDKEKAAALAQCELTKFDEYCLYGGGIIAAMGLGMAISGSVFLGIIAVVAGIGLISNHFTKKKKAEAAKETVNTQYEERRNSGIGIIRGALAEVVDFRSEFATKDAESQNVIDFLSQISPEQYVRKIADTNRRIRM